VPGGHGPELDVALLLTVVVDGGVLVVDVPWMVKLRVRVCVNPQYSTHWPPPDGGLTGEARLSVMRSVVKLPVSVSFSESVMVMLDELTVPLTPNVTVPVVSHGVLGSGWFVTWTDSVRLPVTSFPLITRVRVAVPPYVQPGGPVSCMVSEPDHVPVTSLAGDSVAFAVNGRADTTKSTTSATHARAASIRLTFIHIVEAVHQLLRHMD
jgi:hypothetical protein